MSSLSSSIVSITSRATNEEEDNNKRDQTKTMNMIKGMVDNEREENKSMKNELKQEMAGLSRQLAEQNAAQEQLRIADTARQNKVLDEMRFMMMQLMSTKVNPS